jgi:hypothetical protein
MTPKKSTYKLAKGALPWQPGDEKPEDALRRLRNGEPPAGGTNVQKPASLKREYLLQSAALLVIFEVASLKEVSAVTGLPVEDILETIQTFDSSPDVSYDRNGRKL